MSSDTFQPGLGRVNLAKFALPVDREIGALEGVID